VEGSCEHGNEPSGSIKCWEILEQLNNCAASLERLCSMQLVTLIMDYKHVHVVLMNVSGPLAKLTSRVMRLFNMFYVTAVTQCLLLYIAGEQVLRGNDYKLLWMSLTMEILEITGF
jgi:hypothetical protein